MTEQSLPAPGSSVRMSEAATGKKGIINCYLGCLTARHTWGSRETRESHDYL